MEDRPMRFVPRIFLGALLALAVITSAAAATQDGKTPSTAMPLSSIASTNLTGSLAGSFAYFTSNYPGDGSAGRCRSNRRHCHSFDQARECSTARQRGGGRELLHLHLSR